MTGAAADARRPQRRGRPRAPSSVTGAVVLVTVVAYLVQLLTGGGLQQAFQYAPLYSLPATGAPFEPWRMLTSALIHQPIAIPYDLVGIAHIGFNMGALWLFGRPLETVLGGRRLLAVYVLGALGGSVGVLLFSVAGLLDPRTGVYGASGAVFAVLGASAVLHRRLRVDPRSLLVLIGINLVIGVVIPGIAWQAHLGGLAVGALTALAMRRGRWAPPALLAVLLVALAVLPALLIG